MSEKKDVQKKKILYFDMDGVLADFDRGIRELCGIPSLKQEAEDKAADERMWDVVAKHDVPYILTLAQELRKGGDKEGYDYTMSEVLRFFEERLDRLHRMGVKDVVLDPGFGFGKTLEDNYTILREMEVLKVLHAPMLVGVSRKSMLYKPLGLEPKDVLPATIAAQVMALERGANILRVHDVAAAKQAIQIVQLTHKN